jgi:hypothetical protein
MEHLQNLVNILADVERAGELNMEYRQLDPRNQRYSVIGSG